jgi:hypothetical protein
MNDNVEQLRDRAARLLYRALLARAQIKAS